MTKPARISRLLLLTLVACQGEPPPSPGAPESPVAGAASIPIATSSADKIQLKDRGGNLLFKLKPKDDDYKLYDGSDAPLGKVRVKEDRVVLKGPDDAERWKVKRKDDGSVEVEDAAGSRLYRLKPEGDGDWKLKDASDETLIKCKRKDGGYEMRAPDGTTIAKIKVRDGKLSFETEDGERLLDLKGTTDARAGMWFAAPMLDRAQQAALFTYFERIHG